MFNLSNLSLKYWESGTRSFLQRLGFKKGFPPQPGALCPDPPRKQVRKSLTLTAGAYVDEELQAQGFWSGQTPLCFHLGCGMRVFEGYFNIDYPADQHPVMTMLTADVYADIATMNCGRGTVDEIRLHHVFEHFQRVPALIMLAKWTSWLKVGGMLIIETPDLEGSAKTFLQARDESVRGAIARHLAGDQASPWAFHLDHWWPERFRATLGALGYEIVAAHTERWTQSPYLSNAVAKARLKEHLSNETLLRNSLALLKRSLVNNTERDVFAAWSKQLTAGLSELFALRR
jgi:hypothetical protein